MRSVVPAHTPPCATRHMCTVCRTGRGGCTIYTVQIYWGLAHRCSCSVTAHALAGGVSVVYMRHMLHWGLPRVSDGLTHRVHLCGARSLVGNHIGTAGCATIQAAKPKGCTHLYCS